MFSGVVLEVAHSQRNLELSAKRHIARGRGNLSTVIAIDVAYPADKAVPSTISLYRVKYVCVEGEMRTEVEAVLDKVVMCPFSSYLFGHYLIKIFFFHSSIPYQLRIPVLSRAIRAYSDTTYLQTD